MEQLFGQHALSVWAAGIIWTLVGIALVKTYYYDRDVQFNLKYYLNDNVRDILLGTIIGLIVLRLGDYAVHFIQERVGFDVPQTKDFVGLMIIISAAIQVKLHKERNPVSKKIEAKMIISNEEEKEKL